MSLPPIVLDEPRRLGRTGVLFIALVALIVGLGSGVLFTLFYRLLPEDEPGASSFFTSFQPHDVLQKATAKAGIKNVSWSINYPGGTSVWGRRELHVNHYTAGAEMDTDDQAKFASELGNAIQDEMNRHGVGNFGGGSSSSASSGDSSSSRRDIRSFTYFQGGKQGRVDYWLISVNRKVTVIFSVVED